MGRVRGVRGRGGSINGRGWGSSGHYGTTWRDIGGTRGHQGKAVSRGKLGCSLGTGMCRESEPGLHTVAPCVLQLGMVLLMGADVVRLSQVTHAGLAARDPTCHPPL